MNKLLNLLKQVDCETYNLKFTLITTAGVVCALGITLFVSIELGFAVGSLLWAIADLVDSKIPEMRKR